MVHLLEEYAPTDRLLGPPRHCIALARADHGRLVALMTTPGRTGWLENTRLPRALPRYLGDVDIDALGRIARRLRDHEHALIRLLHAVPPSLRAGLYRAAYADTDRTCAVPFDQMLMAVPERTLHYTAFLSWEQAREPLSAATTRARAATTRCPPSPGRCASHPDLPQAGSAADARPERICKLFAA
jgi:hypothetical protein